MNPPNDTLQPASSMLGRWQRALMPDYNRQATVYWWCVVTLGTLLLGFALATLASKTPTVWLHTAVGAATAMAAGFFPVRIPRSKNSFAAGEIFIFLLLLLHGPAAAALAAAGEATVGSWRTSTRWTSRIASPAMASIAMFTAGSALQALLDALQRAELNNEGLLIVGTMAFSLLYFLCNTLLITALPRLKRRERFQWNDLFGVFGLVGIAYAGSAAVASLLALTYRTSGSGVLMAVVPLIAMMLATLHFFFRQQEADEAMRSAAAAAAEMAAQAQAREAEASVRHVQELHRIAFHDSLTGLPNRRSFHESLAKAVELSKADRSTPDRSQVDSPPGRTGTDDAARRPGGPVKQDFAVMFLDFDRFKLINDSLGHGAGDEFLVLVSKRIHEQLRAGDIVARLGGDEFAVLMQDVARSQDVIALADRLIQVLREPYHVAHTELHSSASIGITSSALPYATPEEVLRDADIAMYKAKADGKARYAVFDTGLHAQVLQRLRLETDLGRAMAAGQIDLVYQPMFELANGTTFGFEALARWTHPELGVIDPDVFVPIAEEAGLIVGLTDSVVQCACAQLRQWQYHHAACAGLTVQVNISGRDITQGGLAGRITRAVAAAGLQPRQLRLELKESTLMERIDVTLPTLIELRQAGIGLSVDDFGTGYSSLKHLTQLPLDSLKIDRSFIRNLDSTDSADAKVVRAIVDLGASLGKSVIAEGIESAAQLAQLRTIGCSLGQGFHLAEPMSAQAISAALIAGRLRPQARAHDAVQTEACATHPPTAPSTSPRPGAASAASADRATDVLV